MRESFLDLLACPNCDAGLRIGSVTERREDDVIAGALHCDGCSRRYPVEGRIPRFVDHSDDYAGSFGWEWNRFQHLQRDSYNGTQITRERILSRTGWAPPAWRNKTVLECGCGSGNETELLADLAGVLVSVDLSTSVNAVLEQVLARPNVLVARADLRRPPFKPGRFDVVYCHRVLQHTPDPRASLRMMASQARPDGSIFVHSYDVGWRSRLHYRYWVRPLIRRFSHEQVFRALQAVGPVLSPIAGFFQRFAILRRLGSIVIPFTNHDRRLARARSTLTARERYDYSLLLTFDQLTPEHDHPTSPERLQQWLGEAGFEDIVIRRRRPVLATARRSRGETSPTVASCPPVSVAPAERSQTSSS